MPLNVQLLLPEPELKFKPCYSKQSKLIIAIWKNGDKCGMKYLDLFQLATLLLLKALLRSGPAGAFRATSVAKGKWFRWKFDLP